MGIRFVPSPRTASRISLRQRFRSQVLGLSRWQLHLWGSHPSVPGRADFLAAPPTPRGELCRRLAWELEGVEAEILGELVENLDGNGYLRESPAAIGRRLLLAGERVEGARKRLMDWEGRGLGCLHFSEFFPLALEVARHPLVGKIRTILSGKDGKLIPTLRLLGRRLAPADFRALLSALGDELPIHPRSGGWLSPAVAAASHPDLEFMRVDGSWEVSCDWDGPCPAESGWRGAQWADALRMRGDLLRKIGDFILHRQGQFLECGILGLLPVEQRELAAVLSCDPSTVSRALRNKYARVPGGNFALGDLFHAPISQSPAVIHHCLGTLMGENRETLLWTKQRLADEIQRRFAISLSRKTIGKYRAFSF
jgi:RNA polymerase sigma-54 factor